MGVDRAERGGEVLWKRSKMLIFRCEEGLGGVEVWEMAIGEDILSVGLVGWAVGAWLERGGREGGLENRGICPVITFGFWETLGGARHGRGFRTHQLMGLGAQGAWV